ncbi:MULTISPECIES: site-specific integrase [Deefgea]|uniref:Tyr recombinase domain-containing protein n=1 Tax=Deefgea chitinilytica TaxID=570276 RepID=A0ABS2CBP1_9NEIS|nr:MULTISPECIES: site-specific integrase [Deefgea]MBM5571569.1 hypothetical protein [Deefgea chitinilytica]MBM9888803.1 site-specific integrase [Deefgea sp. CFH1-16]
MSTTTAEQFASVLSKVDPAFADVDQVRYLITAILGLKHSIDGLPKAIKCLDKICTLQPWIDDYIRHDDQFDLRATIQGLAQQLARDRSRFIPETVSAKNKNNPLHGQFSKHIVLACWTESVLLPPSQQLSCMYFLLACLFVWQSNHPRQDSDQHIPTDLETLCGKIRKLLSERDDSVSWPDLADNPAATLSAIHHAFITSKNQSVQAVANGLQILNAALTQSKLSRYRRQPNLRPTPQTETQEPSATTRRIEENDGIHPPLSAPFINVKYRQPEVSDVGDEPEVEISIELPVDDDGDSKYVGRDGRFARLRSARYRSAMDNQFLPWAWPHLNRFETREIIEFLHQDSDQPDSQIAVMLCVLSIVCGLNYQELGDIRIVNHFDPHAEYLQLCISEAAWMRRFPTLPGRFKPNEQQQKILAPFTEQHRLPLPELAIQLLSDLCGSKTGVLADIIKMKRAEQIEDVMRGYLTQVRARNRKVRVRPARLRAILFDVLMQNSGDDINSSLVINSDEHSPSVALYYYSAPQQTLISRYQDALEKIGLPSKKLDTDDLRYGSRLFWEPTAHAAHIKGWLTSFNQFSNDSAASFSALSQIHNDFAAYTLWVLLCATGHRPAEKFSFNRATLSAEWAMLCDKVIDDAHQARLVRLSPIAQQQQKNYQQHLMGLAQCMNKFDPILAEQIGSCADLSQPNLELPLFFELPHEVSEPISPLGSKRLWQLLKLPTELPRNTSRHWFVSGLREMGVPGEWISCAAGHIQLGQQAWSNSMLTAPTAIQHEWDEAADRWLLKLGFEVATGLLPIRKVRVPNLRLAKVQFLPSLPRTQAQLNRAEFMQNLRTWINETLGSKSRQVLMTDLSLQHAIQQKIQQAYSRNQQKQAAAINCFIRYLRVAGSNIAGAQTLGFTLDCTVEPSPFQADDLVWIERGEWLRASLLTAIPGEFEQEPIERQFAWLMLSLAVFSGLVDPRQQALLYEQFNTSVTYYQNHLWLEWRDGERRVRYWPDFFSTIFILRIPKSEKRPSWATISKEMHRILMRNLRFDVQCPELEFNNQSRITPFAMKALRSWMRMHIPGFLCGYVAGEQKPWAIPRSNLIRLLSGKRVMGEKLETDSEPALIQRGQTGHFASSKKALSDLKALLMEAHSRSNKSQDDGKRPESRKEISKQIDILSNQWDANKISSLMFVIAEYAKFQLHRRTNSEPNAISTVFDYVHSAAEPLLELTANLNWTELDAEDLEQIYVQALDHASPALRVRRAKRLRYFHDFCVQAIGHDELDLCALDPAYQGAAQKTQAQIILFNEYEKALQLLLTDPSQPLEQQQLQGLMLILVFRFGLRVGEVLRLMTCDVVRVGENVVLYIHSNQLGSPKSSAGTRQAPCWTLTQTEQDLLFNRIRNLEHRFDGQSIPLFCQPDNPHQLVHRAFITQRVLYALKLATGDESVRIHDARHTFASAAIASAVHNPSGNISRLQEWFGSDSKVLYQHWLGITHVTRRILYAISQHLGHAKIETSIESYTHSSDLLLANSMASRLPTNIKMAQIAAWSGLSCGLVRQLKLRAGSNENSLRRGILSRLIASSDWSVYTPSILPDLTDADCLPSAPSVTKRISLSTLESILVNLQQNLPRTEIAEHYCISKEKVNTISSLANELAEYLQFDLIRHFSSARFKKNRHQDSNYQQLFNKFETLNLTQNLVKDALNVWKENYSNKNAGAYVHKSCDIDTFIAFLRIFNSSGIVASLNQRYDDSKLKANVDFVLQRNQRYRSSVMGRHGRIIAPQLFLQFRKNEANPSSSAIGMVQFHRLMFLTSIRIALDENANTENKNGQ